jgi:peptidyl-prolyl cis-trans isomerase A (cyclophilin A)
MKQILLGLAVAVSLFAATSAQAQDNSAVIIETSQGPITVELFPQKARDTVEIFLKHVDRKHYDGTIFHSVDPKSRIIGGKFDQNLSQKPTPPPDSCMPYNGVSNERGTIAMLQDLNGDDSENILSSFLINVVDNKDLDTNDNKISSPVFGKVTKGMDVVDKIKNVKTGPRKGMQNVPQRVVLIKSVRRVKQ